MGVPHKVWELDQDAQGSAIQDYLLKKTGQRTVPNIFIKEEHIGGCSDLEDLKSTGKLAELVRSL